MTWEVGQVVVVSQHIVPPTGFRRMIVDAVYKNGGCRTDDGRKWNAHGIEYGDTDKWDRKRLCLAEQVEKREAEAIAQNKIKWAQTTVQDQARSVTDVAVLERALAVLKGEV